MDEGRAGFLDVCERGRERVLEGLARELDLRAVVPRGSTFAIGVSAGMKIVAAIPASRAAHATAWPWFPALAATTPALRSVVGERLDLVDGAADLEEPGPLEVLRLQVHGPAVEPRERLRAVERRHSDALAREVLARGLDVSECGCRLRRQA